MSGAETGGGHLLGARAVASVEEYEASGGGAGLAAAVEAGRAETIATIRRSGLRGRGGAGFPTGIKWRGVAEAPEGQSRFVVCNAAEGEPGTFKDRALIRTNPYQVLEGLAIAAFAVDAELAYVGIKAAYESERSRLRDAAAEMDAAGVLGEVPIRIVTGPDDYLLGEEKALLEVIEGRDPLPRLYPPYVLGLHTRTGSGLGAASIGPDDRDNPTVVNNVETLANVPHILRRGSDWFRSIGTEDSPCTMVFTVCGDVATEAVVELPMGTPLSWLVYGVGGGVASGRSVSAVFPGASNAPIPARDLDTPMDFSSMAAVGSGLGSGGMIVYDDSACVLSAAVVLSGFLAAESCGQCPPCRLGTEALTDRLDRLDRGAARVDVVEEIQAWASRVTDANRCGLGAGERSLVMGLVRAFADEVVAHLERPCPSERRLRLPKLVDLVDEAGRFVYAD